MKSFICEFYNDNHELYMRELRAWRAIFEAVGCKNITLFERNMSDVSIIIKNWLHSVLYLLISNYKIYSVDGILESC